MVYTPKDFKFIDSHTHFFSPEMFKSIWDFFENHTWPIFYKLPNEELVQILEKFQVRAFTTYNYAHKKDIAESMNEWTYEFSKEYSHAIPFGTVWPEDEGREEYIEKMFQIFKFQGIKIQPLVQNFYPDDPRMKKVYKIVENYDKIIAWHAGTAPYRNEYVGFKNFQKFLKNFPDMKLIIAHMGAFEYNNFIKLLDKHENMYLDTAMIYIPQNIFPERKIKCPKPEVLLSYQDKILFGSDFPNIPYSYEDQILGLLDLDLSRSFYENIFYKNAKKLFNLKID
jgi:predicted TIM-barrel fold metal-dependent hydrolase